MERKLNKEQTKAIEHGSGPLLIIAGAGTGKTTVITERIKYLITSGKVDPSEILALTFTEKSAREMETRVDIAMPYGVTQMWISTFHAFCDRILRAEALHIGLDPKFKLLTSAETVQLIRKNLFSFDLNYFRPLGNPTKFIDGLISHFSRLQDEDITPGEYLTWVKKQEGDLGQSSKEEALEVEKWMELAKAYNQYEKIKIDEGVMDYGDLITNTLKLFRERPNVLKQYREKFKYIFVDEFQDTNYAQSQLVYLLAGKDGNISVVGDDDQCLPADAKITTPFGEKEIQSIKKGDLVITAVGKGHTSVSNVNKVFRRTKKCTMLHFTTEDGAKISITDNHKMFCFLPASSQIKDKKYVYLMNQRTLGWRIGMTNNLPMRLKLERRADSLVAIGAYNTEEEARYYESYYSLKYALPTVNFSSRPGQMIHGEWLKKLFFEIHTNESAKSISRDLHIELDSPQFCVGAVTRGESERVKVNFIMCYRNYRSKTHNNGFVANPSISHLVHLQTSNLKTIVTLESAGFKLFNAKKGKRFRMQTQDIVKAWDIAKKLTALTGGILDKKFYVGRFNYQHLASRIVPASHIFPGMYVPILKGNSVVYQKIISRTEEKKSIQLFDLEIDKTHNYVANGFVVHNSIYRFRGAAISNILQFRKHFPASEVVVLTQNYRSNQTILDKAYQLIQHNNPDRLEVVENVDKKLISKSKDNNPQAVTFYHENRLENEADSVCETIRELTQNDFEYKDIAILVRANAHAESFIQTLQKAGIPHQFLGPGKLFNQPEVSNLVSYLKVIADISDSVSLYQVLSQDEWDIEPIDIIKLSKFAKGEDISLFEACERVDEINLTSASKEKVKKIVEGIVRHVRLAKKEPAGVILYTFLKESNLLNSVFNPDTADAEVKAKNIVKLFEKVKTFEMEHKDSTVRAVVEWIDLASELGEAPAATDTDWTEVNAVNILTVHSSKGLEFPVVFLVNLVSQRFPSMERSEQIPIPVELIKEVLPKGDFHLQEERRLFYVGMTRAKNLLYLTAADFYGEGKREKKLSPFIFEALGEDAEESKRNMPDISQLTLLDFNPKKESSSQKHSLHIDYLSYSQIQTFLTCPLHYKLKYLVGVPSTPTAAESLGISVHAALREFYLTVKAGEKPSEDLLLKLLEKNWVTQGYNNKIFRQKNWERAVSYLTGFYQTSFNPKLMPSLVEQPFMISLSAKGQEKLQMGGTIDRVDELSNTIEIIDYKTGEKVPSQREVDNNEQLTFYALAATKLSDPPFNKKPQDIILSLYFFEGQKKMSTQRTASQLLKAEEKIFEVREQIEKSDFKCSNNFFCQNCEYASFCRTQG